MATEEEKRCRMVVSFLCFFDTDYEWTSPASWEADTVSVSATGGDIQVRESRRQRRGALGELQKQNDWNNTRQMIMTQRGSGGKWLDMAGAESKPWTQQRQLGSVAGGLKL